MALLIISSITYSLVRFVYTDKRADIYESSLNNLEINDNLLTEFILSRDSTSKALFSQIIQRKFFSNDDQVTVANSFFDDNLGYLQVRVLKEENGAFISLLEKNNDQLFKRYGLDPLQANLAVDNNLLTDLMKSKRNNGIEIINGLPTLFHFSYYDDYSRYLFVGKIILSEVINERLGLKFNTFMLDQDVNVVFNNFDEIFLKQVIKEKKQIFKEHFKNKKNDLVETMIVGNDKYLVASKLNKVLNISSFTFIKESQAFSSIDNFVIETLKIAFFLLCVANLLAYFFGRVLTNSIGKLTKSATLIADGNYHQNIEISSRDEVQDLASTFNLMSQKIASYISKLNESNANLEKTVIERTKELRESKIFLATMTDSLGQALVAFDQKLICSQIYTKASLDFFKTSPAKKNIVDVLKPKNKEDFIKWVKLIFQQLIPFESAKDLSPKFLEIDNEKKIELDYKLMKNKEGKIENIILVATDKTDEYYAKEMFNEKETELRKIEGLIFNKEIIADFIIGTNLIISKMKDCSMQNNPDEVVLMRLLHTLKGSAAQYGINKLVEVCHGFETEISEKKITLGEQVILAEIVKIESAFQEYLEFAKRYLSQTVVNGVKTREIAESDLNFFYQEIMRSDKETILKIFKERFLLVPFSSLLSAYDELCQNLANQLGKSVLPLQIYGGEILVSKDELTPLTQQFIHVFRNALDHGLENSFERSELGKSPEGLISIYVSENNSSYDITIKDDGKGISPLAIKEKMKKLNYPETEMILGDEFIIQHIFDAAFSTKEEVSDISGRGAGMDALKDLCVSNGGTVFVESVVGSGTTFFINFPRKSGPV